MISEPGLSLLRELRGLCTCSNSHVGGLGAHEPHCVSERATHAVSAEERCLSTCEKCGSNDAPPQYSYRTRAGHVWCGACWAQQERDAGLGAWLRQLAWKRAHMPAFRDMTDREFIAFILRRVAQARDTRPAGGSNPAEATPHQE